VSAICRSNPGLSARGKPEEIDDLPLIVVNIPPVLNETGQEAIVKEEKSLESLVLK